MTTPYTLAAIGGFGMTELLVILGILLLLFGGTKLPSLAKGLGQSVKEFKKATKDDEAEPKPAETAVAAKKSEPAKSTLPGAN